MFRQKLGLDRSAATPLAAPFLDWQVKLRRWTMLERNGSPHPGVAPLLVVRRPGAITGVSAHSIVCGLLARDDALDEKTRQFREIYESRISDGARAIYDAGITYLEGYYQSTQDFDPGVVTTLLPEDAPATLALRADPRCSLVFHVFDPEETSEVGRMRCLQLDCVAEVHDSGPVYDNGRILLDHQHIL